MKSKGGRKSAASLAVVSQIADWRPPPPGVLSDSEAELWRAIVNGKPPDWFDAASVPMLTEFCRLKTSIDILSVKVAGLEAEIAETGQIPGEYKNFVLVLDKHRARQAQFAMKMRLTQQSRYHATKASTLARRSAVNKPWQND